MPKNALFLKKEKKKRGSPTGGGSAYSILPRIFSKPIGTIVSASFYHKPTLMANVHLLLLYRPGCSLHNHNIAAFVHGTSKSFFDVQYLSAYI